MNKIYALRNCLSLKRKNTSVLKWVLPLVMMFGFNNSFAAGFQLGGGGQAAANVCSGSTSVIIHTVTFAGTLVSITSIGMTTTGTYVASTDITNFKLWVNTSNSLTGATLLSTNISPANAGAQTAFTFTPRTPTTGEFYIITMDVKATAVVNNTLAVSKTANVDISPSASNPNGNSASGIQTFISTPATPGTITQPTNKCSGSTGNTFSITAVAGATSYTWSVTGTGWSVTAGGATTSATITIGTGVGTVSVTATNACGTSAASSTGNITPTTAPATPGTITQPANICSSTGNTFSIAAVSGANSYTWFVTGTGWAVTAGGTTTSATITIGTGTGTVSVTATNGCGTSTASTTGSLIPSATPATPGSITQPTNKCSGTTGNTFSISAVTGASSYTWSVTGTGWSVTAGGSTTSATITIGTGVGTVSVTATNACGTSASTTTGNITPTVTPATPGAISGTANQCASTTNQVYSITSVTGATTYTWTVPTGWNITAGAGTNSITVTTGTVGQNGNITVTAGNTCGTSSASSLAVATVLCYCTTLHNVSCSGPTISNVTFNTINNTSGCANTSGTSYNNYYAAGTPTTSVNLGSDYDITVTTAVSGYVGVWIDYNQSGTFETTEFNQVYTAALTGTFTITIPLTATLGTTAMRVRSRTTAFTSSDACTSFNTGETEDYKITILQEAATIDSFDPTGVCQGSTDAVVITGTNFTGATLLTFNGISSPFTLNSSTQITTTVPVGATTGPIAVTTPGGIFESNTNFTIFPYPASCASGLSPANNATQVSALSALLSWNTITYATGYNVYLGTNQALVNALDPSVLVSTNQSGTTYTPGTLAGNTIYYWLIIPVNSCGTYTTGCTAIQFTTGSQTAPTITSFTPALGCAGSGISVTISGTFFTGATSVKFNGVTATYTVVNANTITATLPAGSSTGVITVQTAQGTATSTDNFIVDAGVPACVTLTSPANNATGINPFLGTTLTWNASANASGYDVYLESSAFAITPTVLVSSNQTGTSYVTGVLAGSSDYYWMVIARNTCGVATSCTVYKFTTTTLTPCVTQTTQADFQGGTVFNTEVTTSPGDVKLAYGNQTIDQKQETFGASGYTISATQWIGQTFTPATSGYLTRVDIGMFSNTNPGTATIEIRSVTGGLPTTTVLASSIINFSGGTNFYPVTFTTPFQVTAGTQYAIVLKAPVTGTAGNWIQYCIPNPSCNPYSGGNTVTSTNSGSSWASRGTDGVFRTYISTYYSTGTFTSSIINAGGSSNWTSLSWTASTPGTTVVKFQVWAGNSTGGPFIYVGPDGTSSTYFTTVAANNLSPLTVTAGKQYFRYKAFFTTSSGVQTATLNDVTVCFTLLSCSTPSTQASNITFSNIAADRMTVSWTNGNGSKRIVLINPVSNPTDGTDATANSFYSGSGQQVVYNGSGNSITVTGLSPSTSYCFRVYEANCSGFNIKYLTTVATNNPSCTTTVACNTPIVTIIASPAELCLPGTTTLTASGANTYTWSVVSGTGTLSATTGNPVTATLSSTTTYQAIGSIGTGCNSSAVQITVNVTPPVTMYTTGFETGFTCAGWSGYQATDPLSSGAASGNYWLLRTNTLGAAQKCMYAWGATTRNIDVNKFGNFVLSGNWSLTCEGFTAGGQASVNYGYLATVVSSKRVVLQVDGTNKGGYTIDFKYLMGGDVTAGVYGTLDYSTDGTNWFTAQTFEKVFTTATASVTLPSTVQNASTLYIGWKLITNGVNDFEPTFTIDDITVKGYALPAAPATPAPPYGTNVICPNTESSTFTTTAGFTNYVWSMTSTPVTPGNTISGNGNTATVYWDPAFTGSATISVQTVSNCGASSAAVSYAVTVAGNNQWVGGVSNLWSTAGNWACGQVPNAVTAIVVIPATATNAPTIQAGETFQVKNITLAGGLVLTNNGKLQVAGSMAVTTNNTINNAAGTIEFNGSAAQQTIPANVFVSNNASGITISNTFATAPQVSLSGSLNITGILGFTTGVTFATNNNLTLKSSATATAQVGIVPSGGAITGNVIVERYIPGQRSWRLLAPPLASSAQTIKAAWQEGVTNTTISTGTVTATTFNPSPGFGTHISGYGGVANTAAGFDITSKNNNSLMVFTPNSTDPYAWTGILNTATNNIRANEGYLLFVRGSRAVNLSLNTAAPVDNTVLRATGPLNVGTQTAISLPTSGFKVVGNPFASTLDNSQLRRSSVPGTPISYTAWDPYVAATDNTGAFVTFVWSGVYPAGAYVASGPVVSTQLNGKVQSGQAILIEGTGAGQTIQFTEAHKTSGSTSTIFGAQTEPEIFRTTLHKVEGNGSLTAVDGNIVLFGEYSNDQDAGKMKNINEDFGLRRGGNTLAAEFRSAPVAGDTLFFDMRRIDNRDYKLEFSSNVPNPDGLVGMFKDKYTNTTTTVDLNGTTFVNFSSASGGASMAADRFYMVFVPAAPLPVTFTKVKAYQQNNDINVEWNVENEVAIKEYDVEKSVTGIQFSKAVTVKAKGSVTPTSTTYTWTDVNAQKGANFYRIRSIGLNGESKYTSIVKVVLGGRSEITIFPNPVVDGNLNVQFSNVDKGTYKMCILNPAGQVIMKKDIILQEGSTTEIFKLNNMSHGSYQLEITKPDNTKTTIQLFY
ncbi:hypothetical protein BH09BAC2_BH09BAC2_16080 [soil metagenome]